MSQTIEFWVFIPHQQKWEKIIDLNSEYHSTEWIDGTLRPIWKDKPVAIHYVGGKPKKPASEECPLCGPNCVGGAHRNAIIEDEDEGYPF